MHHRYTATRNVQCVDPLPPLQDYEGRITPTPAVGMRLQGSFNAWILCHRYRTTKVAYLRLQSSVRGYKVLSLRRRYAATSNVLCVDLLPPLQDYEGRISSTPVVGTRLQGTFNAWILCHHYRTIKVACLRLQSSVPGYKTRLMRGSFVTAANS
jgi:hypothetical protein